METLETKKMPENAVLFCKSCDFKCCKKSNWDKHVNTIKHMYRVSGNKQETLETEKMPLCICNCGKEYLTRAGLWKHKKICKNNTKNCLITDKKDNEYTDKKDNEYADKDQLIMMLIKQNSELIKETSEFKNMMMEVIKNGTHNTTNTNSHNKSFNLQLFLNETCKDAMNIMDFVDSIKLQLSDLERIGELGYVEGISNIIVKNLNALDVTQRPVHCTDKKRETLYIKDENKWEKEDDNRMKMHKVVRKVADKNVKLLPKFKEEYPDCSKSTSKYSDQYNKIIVESMGGSGDNDYEKEEKIIKKISKEVFIDKEPS